MELREPLRELWRELAAQKVRSLLSLSSMVWGTLSLILLLAFSFGFEALFAERSAGLGNGIAIAWPLRTTKASHGFPIGRRLVVRRADVLALPAAVPSIEAVSAEFTLADQLHNGDAVHTVPIRGVDPDYALLRNLAPQAGGRWLDAADVQQQRRVVFLGNTIAEELFGQDQTVGRTVMLRGAPFLVVGVMRTKLQDSDYNAEDRECAFVPSTAFLALFGDRPVTDFVFRARDARQQGRCTAAVLAALAQRLHFAADDAQALSIWDTTEQQRMLFFIFLGFHVMLAVSGTFTLVVGGLGIAHLMLLLVRRRTAEIGLKLAVGAAPAAIRREVVAQALALVTAGGLLGVLLAAGAIALMRASSLAEQVGRPYVPPALAVTTAALLAGIGLLCGILPARRASELDPVAALRGT